jgi:L-fuconolactonase
MRVIHESKSLEQTMRIDAHQHFWKADRGDYHWMSPSVSVLCRDYLPGDLRPHLAKHDIAQTILVQAAQTTAETDYLLELAAQNSFIAGVVGWLDMDSRDFPRQFDLYRKNPRFIGLRPMLQDISDPAWIVRPQVLKSLQLLRDADFPFEFLTYTRHLPYVLQALESVGRLRAIIDHISKPEIREGKLEPWKELMAHAARHKTLYCKLSGMITEADPSHWSAEDLRPYIEHVVDCFGWDRVIFGSDWPVCLLAGSYDRVIEALMEVLGLRMDESSGRKLFGTNAAHFYKLSLETP